jgi:integrase
MAGVLGVLGLRIFEACGANIADLREQHGHRVFKIRSKGDETALVPLLPAAARAIDHTIEGRQQGPILPARSVIFSTSRPREKLALPPGLSHHQPYILLKHSDTPN